MEYKGVAIKKARQVDFSVVRDHLIQSGWSKKGEEAGVLEVYQVKGRQRAEVVLPLSQTLADYPYAMVDALLALAKFEKQPVVRILTKMLLPRIDVLRVRRDDRFTSSGTMPLREGIAMLESVRRSILAAACAVVDPRPFYKKLSRREAEEVANNCELGQTEEGSFVATVHVPLQSNELTVESGAPLLFPVAENWPFPRVVTTTLMQSVSRLVTAIDRGEEDRIVDSGNSNRIISANLCEALNDMQRGQVVGELEISVDWASAVPPREGIPRSVSITEKHQKRIALVAERLRPDNEKKIGDFVGKVTQLSGEANDDNLMEGEVVLAFVHDDEMVRAKVYLGHDDYEKACDAHKNASHVSIRGVLKRGRRLHQLAEAQKFKVLYNLFGEA